MKTHEGMQALPPIRDDPKCTHAFKSPGVLQKTLEKPCQSKGTEGGTKNENTGPEPQSDRTGDIETLFATFYKTLNRSLKILSSGLQFSVSFCICVTLFPKTKYIHISLVPGPGPWPGGIRTRYPGPGPGWDPGQRDPGRWGPGQWDPRKWDPGQYV